MPYVFLWENETNVYNSRIVLPYKLGETKLTPASDIWLWYSKNREIIPGCSEGRRY